MNFAITGTTRGIGQHVMRAFHRRYFGTAGHLCAELNRPYYDINDTDSIMLHLCKTFGDAPFTFINNAYDGVAQSALLRRLLLEFNDVHVINIGSVSAFRTDADTDARIEYAADKYHLLETHRHLHRMGKSSTLLELGTVNTEYNKQKDILKLEPAYVAKIILDISEAYYNNYDATKFDIISLVPGDDIAPQNDSNKFQHRPSEVKTCPFNSGATGNNDGSGKFETVFSNTNGVSGS